MTERAFKTKQAHYYTYTPLEIQATTPNITKYIFIFKITLHAFASQKGKAN